MCVCDCAMCVPVLMSHQAIEVLSEVATPGEHGVRVVESISWLVELRS